MERIIEINNIQSGIKENIEDPKQLELLFRKNKVLFKQAFNSIYADKPVKANENIYDVHGMKDSTTRRKKSTGESAVS